ncbi:hypothetical protein PLESTF_001961100 [Pleodorina starrii]|nr:hypothetical protein PLESTF_001961100 [Pleodorina starrii]
MGFKDPAAFPERNSLFDAAKAAAQHAAAGKTAAAAGSTAQAPQPPLQLDDDSRDALKFRRLLDDNLPLHPCCVCGIRMRRCDLQLTMLEECVVAPARVLRHLAICRHARDRSTAASEVGHALLRAHIISFNNPGPDSLAAMFPLPPDRVPEIVSVVLVAAAQTEAEIIDLAKRTNALHLRGRVIACWARWLAEVYPHLRDRLDHGALQQWEEAADSIPRNVLAAALHVDTEEEALTLGEQQQQRQAGYAAARFGGPEQAAAHSTAGLHTHAPAQASVVDEEVAAVADANAASAHLAHLAHSPVRATAPTGSIADPTAQAAAPAPGQPDVYMLQFPPSPTGAALQPHPEHAAALRSAAQAATVRQHSTLPAIQEAPPPPVDTASARMHTSQPAMHAAAPPPPDTPLPAAAQRTPMYGADEAELLPSGDSTGLPHILRVGASPEDIARALAQQGTLVESSGSTPISDYGAEWPLLAHPNRFPNGTGAKPEAMSEKQWVTLQLQRWYPPDDSSSQAPHFILDMFDRLQRHEVLTGVRRHLTMHPGMQHRLAGMTYEQVLSAVELLAMGLRGRELAERLDAAPPIVADLVHGVRIATSRVAGTSASIGALRSRAYGNWLVYGPPAVSLTLNPSSLGAAAFFTLCGQPYSFDEAGAPVGRPGDVQRWQIAVDHPVASAEYFRAFLHAFMETYAGWRIGEQQQHNRNCLFGRVQAWFAKPETTQRAELHGHISLWLHAFHPDRLEAAIRRGEHAALLRYMERVQNQGIPAPTLTGVKAPLAETPPDPSQPAPERRQQPCGCAEGKHVIHARSEHQRTLQAVKDALRLVRKRTTEPQAKACQHPLSEQNPDPEAAALYCAEAMLEVLMHDHIPGTCTTGHTPVTDDNCRFRIPYLLNWTSHIDEHTGSVHLQRFGRTLVAHICSLLLAHPCNHTLAFACEVSRALHEQRRWDKHHPAASLDDPRRPKLRSMAQLAADAADYALKYNTKGETSEGSAAQLAGMLLLRWQQQQGLVPVGEGRDATIPLQASPGTPAGTESAGDVHVRQAQEVQEQAERGAHDSSTLHARQRSTYEVSRWNLAHACNVQTIHTTLPSTAAALHLIEGRGSYESYSSQPIDYRVFQHPLLAHEEPIGPPPPDVDIELMRAHRDAPMEDASVPEQIDALYGGGEAARTTASAQPGDEMLVVTRHTDYMLRGPDYAHLCPVIFFMLHYKRKLHPDETTPPHPLDPRHPQAETHSWVHRRHFATPQPLNDPPIRPSNDSPPAQRDAYAAFALGNFVAYSEDNRLDLSSGLWAAYQQYFCSDAATSPTAPLELQIARHMLDNADSLAQVRAHADEQRLLRARADQDVMHQAETALMEDVEGEEFVVPTGADEEDDATTEPHTTRHSDAAWRSYVLADDAHTRLHDTYLHPPRTIPGQHNREKHYIEAALKPLPDSAESYTAVPPENGLRDGPDYSDATLENTLEQQLKYDPTDPSGSSPLTLRLVHAGTSNVRAQLFLLQRQTAEYPTPGSGNEPPPYVLLPPDSRPTADDTARLFTLSDEQARVFKLYAAILHAENAGHRQEPLTAILTGKAGTGKSRVFHAILWHAFQHGFHHMVAVVSYTWRAALHDTTPVNIGVSTTTFFRVHGSKPPSDTARMQVAARLNGVRLILLDEFSCCSPPHWARIVACVHTVRGALRPDDIAVHDGVLADLHGLFAGDPPQLSQPGAPAMHTGAHAHNLLELRAHALPSHAAAPATATSSTTAHPVSQQQPGEPTPLVQLLQLLRNPGGSAVELGVQLWHAIPHAFLLTKPFRQTDTDQHPNLLEIAEIFNGRGEASPAQVDSACDQLNKRTLKPTDLAQHGPPKVVVLRHSVRLALLPHLLRLHAAHAKQPLFIWRSVDLTPEGGALSASVFQELERLGGSENDGAVPTVCTFFPGIQYNLTTTTNPTLRHVHNNVATGTGMVLDPREPPLADSTVVHVLRYPPRAIIIRPDGLDNSIRIGQLQAGEIVVAPITVQFTPHSAQNPQPIRRYGFPLEPVYATTDYYVQGATFRGFWVAHLANPPTGSYHRASLYVLPTRFTSLANFFLLTPLWPAHDPEHHEEKKVKQCFHKLAGRDPDLAAEWELHQLESKIGAAHVTDRMLLVLDGELDYDRLTNRMG